MSSAAGEEGPAHAVLELKAFNEASLIRFSSLSTFALYILLSKKSTLIPWCAASILGLRKG